MRKTYSKYSRRHGQMSLRSCAPGDGSIDFNWASDSDPNGDTLDEPVTESDVSEWMIMPENSEKFRDWEILVLGKSCGRGIPYDVRIAHKVIRPFGSSKKLAMDDMEFDYVHHGKDDSVHFHSGNTDFYGFEETGSKSIDKVVHLGTIGGLCFFLNHERDFELNGLQLRGTKKEAENQKSINQKLKPVPRSMVGKCVGDYPARKIYRKVEIFGDDPYESVGERWIRAHRATAVEGNDYWKK